MVSKILSLFSLFMCVRCFNPFDDGQYDINWGGPLTMNSGQVSPDGDLFSNRESIVMITKDNEKYRCILPQEESKQEDSYSVTGAEPDELLESLVLRGECAYRLDTYWTYELCHGRHVKQFHEVKAGVPDTQVQEYYLGKLDSKVLYPEKEDKAKPVDQPPLQDAKHPAKSVPTRKINGYDFPYHKVVMVNGTPCDLLGNTPRMTNIIYMCNPKSSSEIISVKELQTCQYEVEVFTPLLCANAAYRYREKPVHHISCHSLDGSPQAPRSYSELLDEQFSIESLIPKENVDDNTKPGPGNEYRDNDVPQADKLLTSAFLHGEYCLVGGGSGSWWKYQFCYGKQVTQFHEDGSGPRINILLGKWNKEAHIKWKKDRKKITSTYTDHFYSGGEICDITGNPRTVQVRLKCKESKHVQEVALSLTEPRTCEYVLTVESPIICPLLQKMDENGIFEVDDL
ncbi:endoplasmic reticulum lectin 1-like isoform X2 [Acropora millepora]|uniref:endoplasmic reticulum lectin 1-like isoform X2 n=1 Tax=Acropora millepora TaxID=45264 RepID=UPI001CF5F52D|nr:endoplasmic reticulum lectin 1-like isoform X2 [Acropora millepora]